MLRTSFTLVLLLACQGAHSEQIPVVNSELVHPEFHPIGPATSNAKRAAPSVTKPDPQQSPVLFQSHAFVDAQGEMTLQCDEIDNPHGHGVDHE